MGLQENKERRETEACLDLRDLQDPREKRVCLEELVLLVLQVLLVCLVRGESKELKVPLAEVVLKEKRVYKDHQDHLDPLEMSSSRCPFRSLRSPSAPSTAVRCSLRVTQRQPTARAQSS